MKVKANKPPAHTQRFVLWTQQRNDRGQFTDQYKGEIIMLVGYCPDTLGYFAGLFNEVKAVVPSAKAEDAICTKVRKSSSRYGFTMLMLPIQGNKRPLEGFKPYKWRWLDIQGY
jgi:hypothetical protein